MSASRRMFAADTFSLIVFGLVVGGSIELLSGLTLAQTIISRAVNVPVNMIVARPYGIFRDWIMKIGGAERGGFFRKSALDALSFMLFQLPLYLLILGLTGADMQTILTAGVAQVGGLLVMGRPYGLWMQFCRQRFVPEYFVRAA